LRGGAGDGLAWGLAWGLQVRVLRFGDWVLEGKEAWCIGGLG